MTAITLIYKQVRRAVLALLVFAACFALTPSNSFAGGTTTIYIYENGSPVDETSCYSYSDNHLVLISDSSVVGSTYGSPEAVMDENNSIVGYRWTLVDTSNNVIGFLWSSSAFPL